MPDGSDATPIDAGRREQIPARAAWAVTGAGLLAATILPGSRIGLSLFLVAVAVAITVVIADRDVSRHEAVFGTAALALAFAAVIRTAEWVVAVDLLAAAGVASFAVTEGKTWRRLAAAPLTVVRMMVRVPAGVARPVIEGVKRRDTENLGTLARTGGLTVVLLAVFGTLFVSADAAFARLATDVFVPDVEVGRVWLRLALFGLVTVVAGGFILARPSFASPSDAFGGSGWGSAPGEEAVRKPVEWVVPIAILDLLFASFVAVQMTVLFGGRHHVELTPGLTYAEYARQGFFQLLAVAALVLIVVAVTIHVARPKDATERRLAQATLGMLCLLTLVVLSSAWYRLGIYEDVYGLTRLRVSVYAAIAWLACIFAFVIAAGVTWRAGWLPRAAALLTAAGLLVFTIANPDALIAERNVARYHATGSIDASYLASLSEDAIPVLVELPEEIRDCVVTRIVTDRGTRDDQGWTELNLSRARARAALDAGAIPTTFPVRCHALLRGPS
ncbi:MAG: DUF4173 domain-containing protein [Actinobacteria bacterium]|nr:DUF4173 domain-containing protein [Actinomycetota bacterium]